MNIGGAVIINSTRTTVAGAPTFPYRGIMVDTARHYQPITELLKMLDGMAASSLNTFHWHLTDAQAFPWNSTAEPLLVRGTEARRMGGGAGGGTEARVVVLFVCFFLLLFLGG